MREQTYEVRAERSGRWWALSVPSLPGVFSQARNLEQAEAMAADAIGLFLDIDPVAVRVRVQPDLGDGMAARVAHARKLTDDARLAQEDAAHFSRLTVRALLEAGCTQRDAATVMGVSFQRVSQLAQEVTERLGMSNSAKSRV